MTEQISQRELRNESGRIMRALDEGRSFILNRNGRPMGELRPLRRERLVDTGLVAEAFAKAPAVDSKAFRVDVDALIDQSVDPGV